jgi:hypothetical protein
VAACGLGISLGLSAWAQDTGAGQNKDRGRGEEITARGVVAEVTAEGEMAIDYRTNRPVLVEATYLTIVQVPGNGRDDAPKPVDAGRKNDDGKKDQAEGDDDNDRRNVYIVSISPRTKVYQESDDSGKADQKKEASLDRIDLGEVVEVQMTRRTDSEANAGRTRPGRPGESTDDIASCSATPGRSPSCRRIPMTIRPRAARIGRGATNRTRTASDERPEMGGSSARPWPGRSRMSRTTPIRIAACRCTTATGITAGCR